MQDQNAGGRVEARKSKEACLVDRQLLGGGLPWRWALAKGLDSLLQAAEQGVSWHQPCFNTMTSDHGGLEVETGRPSLRLHS